MTPDPATPVPITAPWLDAPELRKLFHAFDHAGTEARVVGGAVRNTLLALPVTDIDLATPALPKDVIAIAEANRFVSHPTGLQHGTVTVVVDGKSFEVTTLRRDVETDGRHATVAFTADWAADAARRDFTINALYCTANGTIIDHTQGLADLAARRIRFIGTAETRIREDYLRILRFYRLNAQYGVGPIDDTGRIACEALRSGLKQLSIERVQTEIFKLLATPRAAEILSIMQAGKITDDFFSTPLDTTALQRLIDLEADLKRAASPALRLAVVALLGNDAAQTFERCWKFSNADMTTITRAIALSPTIAPNLAPQAQTERVYRHGREASINAAFAAAASDPDPKNRPRWLQTIRELETRPVPVCPIGGAEILSKGVPKGPMVGTVLSEFERLWLQSGAMWDDAESQQMLAKIIATAGTTPPRD